MTAETKLIDYIRRGYSNKYINSLLDVREDEIEDARERVKKSLGIYGNIIKKASIDTVN